MDLSRGEKILRAINYTVLVLVAAVCLIPVWHVFCASISDPQMLNANQKIVFWPLGEWTIGGYQQVLKTKYILHAYLNTIFYVAFSTFIGMALTIFGAYGLSRKHLALRKPLNFFLTFTMLFSGGLIPTYIVVRNLGMLDTIWAIIIPGCVSVYNMMIMRTSFASVPEALEEAAEIDGAGHFTILFGIILPVSKAVLAVITLFYVVQNWNSWFHTAIYVRKREMYPLQLWLRDIVISESTASLELDSGDVNAFNQTRMLVKYCVIVISIIPMMIVYPFVQRYFVKGVMIGSIKE
ncbi:MAG: carbohydrate ABC transporter permease [Clostridia bacterium]|nr:carbohydrate ABC transporter permease [Clostridia bacterium]